MQVVRRIIRAKSPSLLLFGVVITLVGLILRPVLADYSQPETAPGPGEVGVEGRLSGALDSGTSSCTIHAEQVVLPDSSRTWLPSITTKTVALTPSTVYFVNGQSYNIAYYKDDGVSFFHIFAIGRDLGHGEPLQARFIFLTKESPSQRFLFDNFQDRATNPSPTPAVVHPLVTSWSQTIDVNGGSFNAAIVCAKLSTVTIRCGLAHNEVGLTEPLDSIASRFGAIAAINGSFFNSDDSGPIKMPDMPLVSRGNLVNYSNAGVILGFTDDGTWRMDRSSAVTRMCGCSYTLQPGDDPNMFLFWSHVTEAVGCGPRLIVDGKIQIDGEADRIYDSDVLNARTLRSAVGITQDGHIYLVVVHRAILSDIAAIMAQFGCVQSMNLDGGSSSGLWCRGHTLIDPGRYLSNALLIMPKH